MAQDVTQATPHRVPDLKEWIGALVKHRKRLKSERNRRAYQKRKQRLLSASVPTPDFPCSAQPRASKP